MTEMICCGDRRPPGSLQEDESDHADSQQGNGDLHFLPRKWILPKPQGSLETHLSPVRTPDEYSAGWYLGFCFLRPWVEDPIKICCNSDPGNLWDTKIFPYLSQKICNNLWHNNRKLKQLLSNPPQLFNFF